MHCPFLSVPLIRKSKSFLITQTDRSLLLYIYQFSIILRILGSSAWFYRMIKFLPCMLTLGRQSSSHFGKVVPLFIMYSFLLYRRWINFPQKQKYLPYSLSVLYSHNLASFASSTGKFFQEDNLTFFLLCLPKISKVICKF